ncbi:MAG: ribosomal protein L11 methyltransferase-domain-containing protein [Monoraphidium minutum]|nr:MAG: ribosomal protein L11 methyltransferase-domain-containing protein [Monoraphidium minutum]
MSLLLSSGPRFCTMIQARAALRHQCSVQHRLLGAVNSQKLHVTPPLCAGASSGGGSGSSGGGSGVTTSATASTSGMGVGGGACSRPASELVTRMLLGSAGTLCGAGLPPGAVAAFASAADAGGAAQEPTCTRCRIEPLSAAAADALSDVLLSFGAQSVVVEEYRAPGAAEQEVYGAESGLWDTCSVACYFPLEADADAALAAARDVLESMGLDEGGGTDGGGGGTGGGTGGAWRYDLEPVVNTEWVEQIKASYVPLCINPGLYIIPTWSDPEDPAAVNITLEPGVAFGTGEHPTTRLCLGHLWSARASLRGARVVDYGSGSGVLGIAALLFGAEQAVGTDTDPLAVRAAARNAGLNGCGGAFVSLQCSPDLAGPEPLAEAGLPSAASYDLVVANILRGPLLELAPRLAAYARPGGRLALSGILAEQVPDVRAAYSDAFEGFAVEADGSWALVTATRRH